MNKKKLNIIIIVLIIFIIGLLIYGYYKKNEDFKAKEYINNTTINNIDNSISFKEVIEKYQQEYNNYDIKGILTIDNLFTTQVVQTTDNNFYISHDLYKKNNFIGAAFIDYRNNIISGKQINFYGHNSTKYNIPFKNLTKYLNENFYKNNKIIKLIINDEERYYEIFSIFKDKKSSKDEHMNFNYNNNEEWLNHFNKLKNNSIYNSGLSLSANDNIIVLQTCLFGNDNGKLLIISAKQVNI